MKGKANIEQRVLDSLARDYAHVNREDGVVVLERSWTDGRGTIVASDCDGALTLISVSIGDAVAETLDERMRKAASWLRRHGERGAAGVGFDEVLAYPVGPIADAPTAFLCDHVVGQRLYDLSPMVGGGAR